MEVQMMVSENEKEKDNHLCRFTVILLIYLFSANSLFTIGKYSFRITKENVKELSQTFVRYSIDDYTVIGDMLNSIEIGGWVCSDAEANNRKIGIMLVGENNSYLCETDKLIDRASVKTLFNLQDNFHGFRFCASTVYVKAGTYKISAYIDEIGLKKGICYTPYVLIKDANGVQITAANTNSEKINLDSFAAEICKSHIDIHEQKTDGLHIAGWAFAEGQDTAEQTVYCQLQYADGTVETYTTNSQSRTDVGKAFGSDLYNNAGFNALIPAEHLREGEVSVAILVENNGQWFATQNAVLPEKTDRAATETEDAGILGLIGKPLGWLISVCYGISQNYVLAIVIFTALTKLVLLPVSMWTQKNGITMVKMMPEINQLKIKYFGDKDTIAEKQQKLNKKYHYHPLASSVPLIIQVVLLMGVTGAVRELLGASDSVLTKMPFDVGGAALLMPVGAGLAALCLTLAQNKLGPLQREQSRAEQWSTGVVSVGISLFLGAFVSLGTGVYWICSNLFSIPLQLLLNVLVDPKRYIDYKALEESKKELEGLNSLSANVSAEDRRREREDYKRFFNVVNKHLVFYSESSGFYKYFKGIIEYLLAHTNLTIHYITSDPKDQIFEIAKTQPQIRPYYIGEKKLITLFMKMDADVVVMTMPDIENFHLKRSYVRKDIEYVYVQHGIGSINLTMRKGSEDHYDTVFCCGKHQKEELELSEKIFGTPKKNLVEQGYCLIDEMIAAYDAQEHPAHNVPQILIAPSWQKDNIVDCCLERILDKLSPKGYQITVRPHPQEVRQKETYMQALKEKYSSSPNVTVQTDFSSNTTVMDADLLITDWSGIAWEYAYTTKRPVLFIHTPMKIMNPDWEKIPVVPMNIALRNEIGRDLMLDELDSVGEAVQELLDRRESYREAIRRSLAERLYHPGHSAEIGADYIIRAVRRQIERRKVAKK